MEKTVVLKIGGGILRNKDSFDRVVKIVSKKKSEGCRQLVVISALYGVTDFLINSLSKCLIDPKVVEEVVVQLKKMHKDYLINISDKKVRQNAEFALDEKISVLEKFLYGISYLKEISPRSRDMVQSFGEKLSPIVLEAFLLDKKVDSVFIDAEDAGIACKGQFENALVDYKKTETNLNKTVLPHVSKSVVLLPGYYGIDESGDVKTFGRGGTDYSSGFIASIFNAELEIWKDVSGFMTADPKIVPNAKRIPLLSYEEAEELGYLGAKILHPKTIDPLRQKGLSAEIKDIFHPEVKGTMVCGTKQKNSSAVKSITAINDIAIISVESSSMVNVPGFASLIFSRLAENGVSIGLIVTSEASIAFSVDPKNLDAAVKCAKSVSEIYPCEVKAEKDLSLVAIVGEGMKETPGVSGKLFGALGKAGVNIELVSQGASQVNVTFVINKKYLEKTVRVTHDAFIQ